MRSSLCSVLCEKNASSSEVLILVKNLNYFAAANVLFASPQVLCEHELEGVLDTTVALNSLFSSSEMSILDGITRQAPQHEITPLSPKNNKVKKKKCSTTAPSKTSTIVATRVLKK